VTVVDCLAAGDNSTDVTMRSDLSIAGALTSGSGAAALHILGASQSSIESTAVRGLVTSGVSSAVISIQASTGVMLQGITLGASALPLPADSGLVAITRGSRLVTLGGLNCTGPSGAGALVVSGQSSVAVSGAVLVGLQGPGPPIVVNGSSTAVVQQSRVERCSTGAAVVQGHASNLTMVQCTVAGSASPPAVAAVTLYNGAWASLTQMRFSANTQGDIAVMSSSSSSTLAACSYYSRSGPASLPNDRWAPRMDLGHGQIETGQLGLLQWLVRRHFPIGHTCHQAI
jgi:hypothetical protein